MHTNKLKIVTLALSVLVAIAFSMTCVALVKERNSERTKVAADALTINALRDRNVSLKASADDLKAQVVKKDAEISDLTQKASAAAESAVMAANTKDVATKARVSDQSNKGTCDAEIARIRSSL